MLRLNLKKLSLSFWSVSSRLKKNDLVVVRMLYIITFALSIYIMPNFTEKI